MEPVHGTNKSAEEEEEDFISRMPENVITNILDRLPIRNAVGTSILSTNWRFKWTMLTQLIVDGRIADYDWRNIYRLLIHLKGPITKSVLYTPYYTEFDVKDINHWVMFLSRKGIKEFTLINYSYYGIPLKLPTHLFSCLDLKHLELDNCCFHSVPSFCGFPNLLSLELSRVTDDSGSCAEFITKCPLLEILKIIDFKHIGKLKLVEIAKLKNLKMLCMPLCILDNLAITSFTIFQLVGSLPKLHDLSLDFKECTIIEEAGVRKCVYTAFPCLKTLSLYPIDLSSSIMVSCAFEMIWGFSHLQTLEITAFYFEATDEAPAFCFPEVDDNPKLQLQSVVFTGFRGSDTEVYLIKSLLVCSPLLKNIIINAKSSQVFGGDNGKLLFATKLLTLHRASPIAEVKLNWF